MAEGIRHVGVPMISKDTLIVSELIGRGAFAAVYRAKRNNLHDEVAVKVVCEQADMNHTQKTKFMEEVEKMFATRCAYIIQLHGICMDPGYHAIIMEYCPNGSVASLLEYINLPWPLRWRILYETARGMNYLHTALESRILHLDLKSQNVLLNEDFHVKICDFGLSLWRQHASSSYTQACQTGTGGTITHMPPEALQDINCTPSRKFDVYSFAIFGWEILTRKKPYEHATHHDLIKVAVIDGQRPDMKNLPKYTEVLASLVQKYWNQDPKLRPYFQDIVPEIQQYYDEHKPSVMHSIHCVSEQKSHVSSSPSRTFDPNTTLNDAVSITFTNDIQEDAVPEGNSPHHRSPNNENQKDKKKKQKDSRSSSSSTTSTDSSDSFKSGNYTSGASGQGQIVNISHSSGIHIGDTYQTTVHVGNSRANTTRAAGDTQYNTNQSNIQNPEGDLENERMIAISKDIGKAWRQLGRGLGLLDGELDALDHDYKTDGLHEICYQMLRKWKDKKGRVANRRTFAECCVNIGRQDLMQKL